MYVPRKGVGTLPTDTSGNVYMPGVCYLWPYQDQCTPSATQQSTLSAQNPEPAACLALGESLCDWLFGSGTWLASQGLSQPGMMYPNPPNPPPVSSPTGSALTEAPASGADASALVQSITNQQIAATQQQNQGFFSELGQSYDDLQAAASGTGSGAPGLLASIPLWAWVAGGALVVFIVMRH